MADVDDEQEVGTDIDVMSDEVAQKVVEGLSGESGGQYPQEAEKESVFKFFKHLLHLPDSSKSANLSEPELGHLYATVRGYQDIALFCDAIGYDRVSKYSRDMGEITLATSLSRKGFLAQLFVTQIRRESKFRNHPAMTKGGVFSKPQPVESSNIEEA